MDRSRWVRSLAVSIRCCVGWLLRVGICRSVAVGHRCKSIAVGPLLWVDRGFAVGHCGLAAMDRLL